MAEKDNRHNKIFNSVAVVSQLEGIPIPKAMEKLAKIVYNLEQNILELEKDILSDNWFSEDTHLFVDRVNYVNGGHFKVYHAILDRYYK